MNPQEIFDTISKHLLTQKKKALNSKNYCLYRTDNDLKCAIGCLIPDDLYDPEIEGFSVADCFCSTKPKGGLEKLQNILAKLNLDDNKILLERIQSIHDDNQPEYWLYGLNRLAKEFKLSNANEQS